MDIVWGKYLVKTTIKPFKKQISFLREILKIKINLLLIDTYNYKSNIKSMNSELKFDNAKMVLVGSTHYKKKQNKFLWNSFRKLCELT